MTFYQLAPTCKNKNIQKKASTQYLRPNQGQSNLVETNDSKFQYYDHLLKQV